ncbi:MAG: hypothetical protein C6Y22_18495 [Hapalosiphonaceae cyanobacterium JJU2]|nr:MAG: hypothetical protein C6Y22_18495 [Hapalosiphonaceae cyanobacterium JJU2]
MAPKKPNEKNTKSEILEAYNELVKEKSTLISQLEQLAKERDSVQKNLPKSTLENKPVMNQQSTIQQKMNFTIENLAKIQIGFGSAANELSEQLTTKASKLAEIGQLVEDEIQQLKELHNLEISEDILESLIQSYEENAKAYQEESRQRSEALIQEIQEQKQVWEKEKEEYRISMKERDDNLKKSRHRDATEYKYNLELQRQLEMDEYEQQQKLLYKELEEFRQEIEKQWLEREKAIAEQEKQFEEHKTKVEAFPKEKEAVIKKATEEGKGIAHYQAKIKADLFAKEVEGQKRFYEQRLQSLEQTITNQEARIQNLSKQLESALKQVQDLAVKAIEGSASMNSYQAIKEIALEQAKSQVKNK